MKNNEWILVSRETVVLRRWERWKQKFGFIKRVDKGWRLSKPFTVVIQPLSTRLTKQNFWWKTIVLHALHVYFSFFSHFADVLVLSTTWKDLFCSWVDDVSIWWQRFNFVFLSLKRWFQFHFRMVGTQFTGVMTFNNLEMITETRSYILTWRFPCLRRRDCLSSIMKKEYPQNV